MFRKESAIAKEEDVASHPSLLDEVWSNSLSSFTPQQARVVPSIGAYLIIVLSVLPRRARQRYKRAPGEA